LFVVTETMKRKLGPGAWKGGKGGKESLIAEKGKKTSPGVRKRRGEGEKCWLHLWGGESLWGKGRGEEKRKELYVP